MFVDDGSDDRSRAILEDRIRRDGVRSRVRLVGDRAKKGKVSAFNLAYTHSTGQIVCLCAADDTLPPDSLSLRAAALEHPARNEQLAVAWFKIRMMSTDPAFDGLVLPKGSSSSRSGGSLTLTRSLAELVFPIPVQLVAEDIWLRYAIEALADVEVLSTDVVLNYRVHEGNSNPRHLSFDRFSQGMHDRHLAWRVLADSHLPLPPDKKAHLEALWRAECERSRGSLRGVLNTKGLTWADRLALASMANPYLHRLRSRLNRLVSGRRGA